MTKPKECWPFLIDVDHFYLLIDILIKNGLKAIIFYPKWSGFNQKLIEMHCKLKLMIWFWCQISNPTNFIVWIRTAWNWIVNNSIWRPILKPSLPKFNRHAGLRILKWMRLNKHSLRRGRGGDNLKSLSVKQTQTNI